MAKTATIERYHVYGTPNHCLALFYAGKELTPHEGISPALKQWIPDDEKGIQTLRDLAKKQGFTHVRFTGDWTRRTKPEGGSLVEKPVYEIEVTDTFGGEANYCWVKRGTTTAQSRRGRIEAAKTLAGWNGWCRIRVDDFGGNLTIRPCDSSGVNQIAFVTFKG